jgi:DNA-binding NarL/FixJ family response regulator
MEVKIEVPALKAGAISYILKDMKMDKLVEALHRAVRRHAVLEGGLRPGGRRHETLPRGPQR